MDTSNSTTITLICSRCKTEKPITEFSRNKRCTLGYGSPCLECRRIAYHANPDPVLNRIKQKRLENLEEERAKDRAYYAANATRLATERYQRYNSNKQYQRELANKRYRRNPEKYKYNSAKRRAAKFQTDTPLTPQEIRDQRKSQKGFCWWCGKKIRGVSHVDHVIPLAKGGKHEAANIVITCAHCNLSKNAKTPQEWAGRLF